MHLKQLENLSRTIIFCHLNSVNPHIKYTMETPGNYGSIPFFDTKCSANLAYTIQTSLYRKPTHTDCYLDWNFLLPYFSQRKAAIHALIYRVKELFHSEILAKEMDYLHRDLLRNN